MESEQEKIRGITLGIALGGDRDGAVQFGTELVQSQAIGRIPDRPRAREALSAWGISFEEGGEPIQQMFTSTPTLKVKLPAGWQISSSAGHNVLRDPRGSERLHWYVHGWDRIEVNVRFRFNLATEQLSAERDVVQVLDGPTVIHTIPIRYPYPRLQEQGHGRSRWCYFELPEEQCTVNFRAHEAGVDAARAWLDENVPGHSDSAIACWSL